MILTPRLRLRALTTRDLPLFRALYCNADTMRHIGKPLSHTLAAASLRATVAATRSGGLRFYTIIERQSRRAIGMCSARPAAWDKRDAELGIMLLPAACRRGHAREALRALIDDAFFRLPIDTVWVQYRRANAGMTRLADNLGFGSDFSPRAGANVRRCVRIPRRPERRDFSHQPARGATMSNIIGFLEQAGASAAMRHASREQLLKAMRAEEIAPEQRNALLQTQRSVLDDLTHARGTMYLKNTAIAPPKKKAPAKKKPAKKAPAKKAPAKRKK